MLLLDGLAIRFSIILEKFGNKSGLSLVLIKKSVNFVAIFKEKIRLLFN